jgi:hypothetical protein
MKIQALKIKSPQLGIFDNGGSGGLTSAYTDLS